MGSRDRSMGPSLTPRRWKRHLAVSLGDHGVFKGATFMRQRV